MKTDGDIINNKLQSNIMPRYLLIEIKAIVYCRSKFTGYWFRFSNASTTIIINPDILQIARNR